MTKILMLGGGHSHAIALDYLARHPIPSVQIQIIHPGPEALYSGMIPGHLSRHYTRDACQIDVQQLARRSGAILTQTEATALDLDQNQVICASGETIGFEVLSINTGSVPLLPPGVILGDRILAVKPLAQFLDQWQRFELQGQFQLQAQSGRVAQSIAIVGAGLGGIEVALNLKARWTHSLDISLFCQGNTIAPTANRSFQRFLTETLARRNIHVTTHATVTNTTHQENHVKLTYRQSLRDEVAPTFMTRCFDAVIFVTQAAAPEWISRSGLATDDRGFIAVEPLALRSTSHSQVFASGDIASIQGFPVPKSGVFAVRQGRPLAQNLRRAALSQPLNDDRSQQDSSLKALSLLNLGNGRAIGSYGDFSMTAPALQPLLWFLKDHIDRRFIRRISSARSSALRENLIAG